MEQLINAVIIENDDNASEALNSLIIENIPDIRILGGAKTVGNGVTLIRSKKPDVVFMDIELDDGSGFDILDQLEDRNFEVIFVTAYNTYFERAMQHFAFSYLLKPIDLAELKKIISRYREVKNRYFTEYKYQFLKEFLKDRNGQILLQVGFEHVAIFLDSIVRCEADGNYTKIYFDNREPILASFALKHYDELLSTRGFFRANRSSLINIKHIKSIYKRESIVLKDQTKVHVSPKNKENLVNLIQLLT